jgi:hypothetical protein
MIMQPTTSPAPATSASSAPASANHGDILALLFEALARIENAPASANHGDMPGASHDNHESDSTNGALEKPVTMASIVEASEHPDSRAFLLELARIDSPIPGDENLHTHQNLRTHDIEALGRLERVDAQSHDAYLCDARLCHLGARRERVNKMQSSYFVESGAGS